MNAFGWLTNRKRSPRVLTLRPRPRQNLRVVSPTLERLEAIELLSHAAARPHSAVHAVFQPMGQSVPFSAGTITVNSTHAAITQMSQMTPVQTTVVPDTLTNFNSPFAPPINLFDPNLGQLVAVHITTTATLTSLIKAENTSTTSGADITGYSNGTVTIGGLNVPVSGTLNGTTATVSVPPFTGGPIDFTGPSSVTFPPLTTTSTQTLNLTDPGSLAFYQVNGTRTTITPTLTAQAQAGANAPNGNLITQVLTSGNGVVTVTYEYLPQCPPITNLVRFGIHHQQTQIQLSFGGTLNATDAQNVNFYTIVASNRQGSFTGPGTTVIPISSAVYVGNTATNTSTVTLTTATQLNVHRIYQLIVNLPCSNGNPTVIEFGGKKSLGGFDYHGKHFVVINGKAFPG